MDAAAGHWAQPAELHHGSWLLRHPTKEDKTGPENPCPRLLKVSKMVCPQWDSDQKHA